MMRMFLFLVFFSIGAAALSISMLSGDLLQYYHNKQLLKTAEESLHELELLNTDYDALLQRLKNDPNLIGRIGRAVLRTERKDDGTVYPRVTPEQLDAARRALTEESNQQFSEPTVPGWLTRCSKPHRRIMLFFCGAALILISFIWSGSGERSPEKGK
ncbi:MAG: hypothetical protein ACYTEW_25490 [Planctomycetota bacterium]